MTDGSWVELPVGSKIAAHKHPLNLGTDEVLQFQDLTATRVPGSLKLRKVTEQVDQSIDNGRILRVGQQIRPDGTKPLVAVIEQGTLRYLFLENLQTRQMSLTGGGALGTGDTDISIAPESVRGCGDDGLVWVGRIATLPYMDGETEVSPRQFHETDGPALSDTFGLGYAVWDGVVKTLHPNTPGNLFGDLLEVELNQQNRQPTSPSWFGVNNEPFYFYTFEFVGGQESPPKRVGSIRINGEHHVRVRLRVRDWRSFPRAITRIHVYRKTIPNGSVGGYDSGPSQAVLIWSIDIYKTTEDYVNWSLATESPFWATANTDDYEGYFLDKNEDSVIGGTYYDRQQLSHEVTALSPTRRRHWLFSDKLFAIGVTADDGKVYGNRLYYSHVNGIGVSCYDIIPPANYVELPFNIFGLVSVRSHRIIIGDSKYAIGYFSGGAIQNWRIYESETEMGCRSAESVTDTPFGAAYVGYDGIYIINGLDYQGPLARGVIFDTEDEYDWSRAKGEFAQEDQEYILVVPGIPLRNQLIVAVNLRTGGVRRIAGIPFEISAIGKDFQGKVLIAGGGHIYRLESTEGEGSSIDLPSPIAETGLRRLVSGVDFQKIMRMAIAGTWGPGSLKVTVTSHTGVETTKTVAAKGDGLVVLDLDADKSPSYAHKFKMEYEADKDLPISTFQIDRVWVEALPTGREFK